VTGKRIIQADSVFETVLGLLLAGGAAASWLGASDFPQPIGTPVIVAFGERAPDRRRGALANGARARRVRPAPPPRSGEPGDRCGSARLAARGRRLLDDRLGPHVHDRGRTRRARRRTTPRGARACDRRRTAAPFVPMTSAPVLPLRFQVFSGTSPPDELEDLGEVSVRQAHDGFPGSARRDRRSGSRRRGTRRASAERSRTEIGLALIHLRP
jgi:hypothetical protein